MAHKGFTYHFTHKRDGKIIAEWDAENLIPAEGEAYIVGVAFLPSVAKIKGWYAGLWAGAYAPSQAASAATLQGLVTEVVAYAGANRPAFAPAAVADAAVSVPLTYTFTADNTTVNGAFVSSSAAKNGSDGLLASLVRFSTARTFATGDEIEVTNVVGLQ